MAETDFENVRISNFQCHVTLTLDRATHHSSISTYVPNLIRITEPVDGWMDTRMYVQGRPNKCLHLHRLVPESLKALRTPSCGGVSFTSTLS